MSCHMQVDFAGVSFQNPVTTCSGTYGFGIEYGRFVPVERLGGISTKGLTLLPRRGNAGVRITETPSGMLNAIGLENPGADAFKQTVLPQMLQRLGDCKVIANISGGTLDDYAQITALLNDAEGIALFEVNISCPNVAAGGMAFGTTCDSAAEVCRVVKAHTDKPVVMKLSPNVTDIVSIAQSVAEAGADGLALINTLVGMSIDVEKQQPVLGNVKGGLSGPCIRPIGVRMVWEVAQAVDLPILGMGGIATWRDAVEYLLAGASMIAVGASTFQNPMAPIEILEGIEAYCNRKGIARVQDLTGMAWRK